MRILFIGDIVGRSGRDAFVQHLPMLKEKLKPDVIIVNGDNAAHGFGISTKICEEFFGLGVDCITGGNHIWDQREIIPFIGREERLLRTENYAKGVPGRGHYLKTLADGRKILILHLMGRLFMPEMENPFSVADEILAKYILGSNVNSIFVDIHAEATSEKMALAQYLNGRVSAVIGTHTHMPTADLQILSKGTGFQTDAGMTGDYDTVIGMKYEVPVQRFTKYFSTEKLSPGDGEGTLCGTFVTTSDQTGLAVSIDPVRVGPRLQNWIPA
ncbi:MAG: metallophosphoesterase [Micavibrio aeruginosavorus]|uniref:Metallophosphoesterase n=1 Tax=Micavibrio aeruginosavorus TaxID=349221 RepID=A0A2W5HD73_9BACT|nr:MAG: metallophosphoesterase [Micavibrio aeruginosavorus]